LEVEGPVVDQSRSDSSLCDDDTPLLDVVNLGKGLNCGKEKLRSLLGMERILREGVQGARPGFASCWAGEDWANDKAHWD
jgi:hypothetical protein